MKFLALLFCCLFSLSAFATAAVPPAESTETTSSASTLAATVDAMSEAELSAALENEANIVEAAAGAIDQQQPDNNSRQVAEALRVEARKAGLKSRLVKFFRAAGHDTAVVGRDIGKGLKTAGEDTLEVAGYVSNAASDLMIFPFEFTDHFVNSALTGKADAGQTTVTHWVAFGSGMSVEGALAYEVSSAIAFEIVGPALAGKLATAGLCIVPSLDHEPTAIGDKRSKMTTYCDNVRAIDDTIEDPAVRGGEKSGAWLGKDVRVIGKDVKNVFTKLFHHNPPKPILP